MEPKIWEATKQNIWLYKQNHPELIIKDVKREFSRYSSFDTIPRNVLIDRIASLVRQSMLIRGVNKWLKVRRDLIAYKKQLKHRVKDIERDVITYKSLATSLFINFKDSPSCYDLTPYYQAREKYLITKTKLEMLLQFRKDLKKLCMTHRWQEWEGKKMADMNSIHSSD